MSMRRTWAMLLVALFSFSLISPTLLASDSDSNLQACCLRNGKHHCAMLASHSSSAPGVQRARCPSFPTAKGVPTHRTAGLHTLYPTGFHPLLSHSALNFQTEPVRLSLYWRADQTRGPPIFLS
jgi:hypothetical protein